MFLRLLWESFARQRRRKLLAGVAILLGTTAVTSMLALALTIGDRIHRELAVYGANIIVYPKAEQLDVKVGGVDIKPATGNAYLKESDLEKLKTIFWANNLTHITPELALQANLKIEGGEPVKVGVTGFRFSDGWIAHKPGEPELHPWWKLDGQWPGMPEDNLDAQGVVVGGELAKRYGLKVGSRLVIAPLEQAETEANPSASPLVEQSPVPGAKDQLEGGRGMSGLKPGPSLETRANTRQKQIPAEWKTKEGKQIDAFVSGILTTQGSLDDQIIVRLHAAQDLAGIPGAISRVEIVARTKPEDAFARRDPDTMSGPTREIWYCRPYANSIAYQIREAIPGSQAEQVRRVEQTEGTVLARISGLMWLVSGAALLAAGFAVSAAMATAVLERRREIGLMRSLGASKAAIALLFYSESGLLAVLAGTVGYLAGSTLAFWLGARIFPGDGATPWLNPVLLPVVVAMALAVAIAGSTPSIRKALSTDPSTVLRVDA